MSLYDRALDRLADHTSTRAEYADEARRRATEASVFTIDNYLVAALSMARADERSFLEDFGTPPPVHLAYALTTEITAWERLRAALAEFKSADPLPRDVPAYAANVRSFLAHQVRLLDVEHDLLRSCLVQQYISMIDTINKSLDEVSL